MPTEERYIKFTYEEIHKALCIYAIESNSHKIPDGIIKNIELSENEAGYINIDIQKEQHERSSIGIKQNFFVMALVFSCQAHNIPLPRNAKKILSFRNDTVILKIGFQQKTVQKIDEEGPETETGTGTGTGTGQEDNSNVQQQDTPQQSAPSEETTSQQQPAPTPATPPPPSVENVTPIEQPTEQTPPKEGEDDVIQL